MGIYAEYLEKKFIYFTELTAERKKQLKIISDIRERDILCYASDLTNSNAPTSIDYSDLLPFMDQLSNLSGNAIDIIIETPGGFAEVVEELVELIRSRYEKVGIIIPGWCKSAGTIFAMAGDEILMGDMSALGPIDAQILSNKKRFSADAFLEGLEKIKKEILETGKLNPAYIPILQNISPGEIQHCENAQELSTTLVRKWLVKYKFKYWETHSTTDKPVTSDEKKQRAREIADELSKQSQWLTHNRSIKIKDLERLRLKITDYSLEKELNEAITRYYALLRMSFETDIYKIVETIDTQIYRFIKPRDAGHLQIPKDQNLKAIEYNCPSCKKTSQIQVNLDESKELSAGHIPYPIDNDIFICPNCKREADLSDARKKIERETGKKFVK